ncbi:5-oxoprolinase subunit PxpB [Tamlana crocina]|uniref:5-oxoprolinase subunit PxpB n=1 Tax=Tamlana crocina TaxID=393006 RepID=A0ABX1DGZ5_9FLAO|nr:5-oxoprolinase subunit PxpB [Tamlana crocina]NJX15571.1 5-oxoprolinase subunit PxpB [Tamlana crocina]
MKFKLTYKPYGQHGVLVEWPASIDEATLNDVLWFKSKLNPNATENIVEVRSSYHSLLIIYSQFETGFDNEVLRLKSIYSSEEKSKKLKSTLWHIPVCYDTQFGVDLESISKAKNLSEDEIVNLHSQTIYTVYFIGFLPGFLYLGGLDERLATPRKATPRLQIGKGSVAIGGNQTGVYPSASPGGWNIIGNSPVNFFNIKNETPCFAKAGDHIKFYSIDLKEHQNIKALVNAGVFQIESEVLDG